MISKVERFWILFIVRFAIGLLFLIASLNQFQVGPAKFSEDLSKSFAGSWVADLRLGPYTGLDFTKAFLYYLPYALCALSVLILTGILLRTALRFAALLLVCLGLGKYLQNDVSTAANDFIFALIICFGLFFASLERKPATA